MKKLVLVASAFFALCLMDGCQQQPTPSDQSKKSVQPEETGETETARLEGKWAVMLVNNQINTKDREFEFTRSAIIHRYEVYESLGPDLKGLKSWKLREETFRYKIDIAKQPKWIDLTDAAGVNYLGIYKFEKPYHLFIEYGKDTRPTDFSFAADSGLTLYKLSRIK